MHGIGAPLVTPFRKNGEIDRSSLKNLANSLANQGVDFLVPCGSAGEAELMTIDERARVIADVVKAAPNDTPVIAGTGHQGIRATKQQTELAADAGADAALIISPFYYDYSEEEYKDYYRSIANDTKLEIYLYNSPSFTGVDLDKNIIIDLFSHENICGLKDASGNLTKLYNIIQTKKDGLDVFVGAPWIVDQYECGGAGVITSSINTFPEVAGQIRDHMESRESKEARKKNLPLIDFHESIVVRYGIPGLKASMRVRNLAAGYPRRPHKRLDEHSLKKIESQMNEIISGSGFI